MPFLAERVTATAKPSEVSEQTRQRNDRARGGGTHRMHPRDLLNLFPTELTDQRLADRSHLWRHPTPVPDIHLDETRCLDAFDVNRLAVIEYGEVRPQARGLDDLSQVR